MADSKKNELSPTRKKSSGTMELASEFVSITSPRDMQKLADTLKTFIVENNLYTELGNDDESKKHVHVEGWQFAGASMGIFPQVVSTKRVEQDGEVEFDAKEWYYDQGAKQRKSRWIKKKNPIFKYEATVELINVVTGRVVGRGVALCSNEETKKKTFDEYAVLSMAETRATGKAYRLCLGWIVKLAGYEGTPAEEIDDPEIDDDNTADPVAPPLPLEDVKTIVDAYLGKLDSTKKMKFLKEWAGTITDKKLNENQYRAMHQAIIDIREQAANDEVQSS